MTQEQKELLIKDLCARLPYRPVIQIYYEDMVGSGYFNEIVWVVDNDEPFHVNDAYIENIKPYLFPLESMTEEQKRELLELTGYEPRCEESCGFDSWGFYVNIVGEYKYKDGQESIILYPDDIGIDWLNKNHFDYRGLIPKGLALDATGKGIY